MRRPSPLILLSLCIITLIFIFFLTQQLPRPIRYFSSLSTPPTAPPWENSTDRFLPLEYALERLINKQKYASNSCVTFPSLVDIHYSSPYWQTVRVANGTANVYGAYWDARKDPVVRLLVVYDKVTLPNLFCHLWYNNQGRPVTMPISEIVYAWKEEWGGPYNNINEPYILTCPVITDSAGQPKIPHAVSLATGPCDDVVTALRVQNEQNAPNKKANNIAVCVKWHLLPNEDVSVKLVEWLELVKLFGAQKAHPNVLKVLIEYSKQGFVDVTESKGLKRFLQNRYIKRRNHYKEELLPYNDCLYRNLNKHDYLAVFDINEIITPNIDSNWTSLLHRFGDRNDTDAYYVKNLFFLEQLQNNMNESNEIPKYSHMLKNVWRTQNYSESNDFIKSFHATKTVLAMHKTRPLKCLYGRNYRCNLSKINVNLARLHHYRENCYNLNNIKSDDCDAMCKGPVRDITLWKWKDVLLLNVKNSLQNMDLIKI